MYGYNNTLYNLTVLKPDTYALFLYHTSKAKGERREEMAQRLSDDLRTKPPAVIISESPDGIAGSLRNCRSARSNRMPSNNVGFQEIENWICNNYIPMTLQNGQRVFFRSDVDWIQAAPFPLSQEWPPRRT
jgi:hypothetical protein